MNFESLLFFSCILLLANNVIAYLPILFLPGFIDPFVPEYQILCQRINDVHPGTPCFHIQPGTFLLGEVSMWTQVDWYRNEMQKYFDMYPDGVNVICHSQGSLIGRAVIETTPNHKVKNYVSLAGPQMGLSKLPIAGILPIPEAIYAILGSLLTTTMYSLAIQNSVSIAGYWHDPKREADYLANNLFLPVINCRTNNVINNENYKKNFLLLNSTKFIAAEQDFVVVPWQSAQGDYYDADFNLVPFHQQIEYTADTYGLKTMEADNRLKIFSLPVGHLDFVTDPNIILTYVVPDLP